MGKCKICNKEIEVGKICQECYYEYHETREELMREDSDYEEEDDE